MMQYVIKPNTQTLIASYPHVSQGKLVIDQKLIKTPEGSFKLSEDKIFISVCHIQEYITTHLNIFTNEDLVFKGAQFLDLNVKASNLYAFGDAGWYGFRRKDTILLAIPENIASLKIKRPKAKKVLVPFENMRQPITHRQSFDDWLKEA